MITLASDRFDLASKRALVCDLDGTLFMGQRPIAPAIRFITTHAHQLDFYYLTNNTSKTPDAYLDKLARAGIITDPAHILTPLTTLENYIRAQQYNSVYAVANDSVLRYLSLRLPFARFDFMPGVNQLIALTYDTEVTYEKLRRASVLLNAAPDLDYVATHGDACCPSEDGPIPDAGGMIALLRVTNGREPRQIFGKPEPSLLAPVLERFTAAEIAVVGDRLYTDKAMADRAGIDFICVLSGETTPESLATYNGPPPAVVADTLGDLATAG